MDMKRGWAYAVSEAERRRVEFDYTSHGIDVTLATGSCPILIEGHPRVCTCSHCRGFTSRFGFKSPEVKAHNSWWTIFWTWNGRRWYIRWTPHSLWKWRLGRQS